MTQITYSFPHSQYKLDASVISEAHRAELDALAAAGTLTEDYLVSVLQNYPAGWTKDETPIDPPPPDTDPFDLSSYDDIELPISFFIEQALREAYSELMKQETTAKEMAWTDINAGLDRAEAAKKKAEDAALAGFIGGTISACLSFAGGVVGAGGALKAIDDVAKAGRMTKEANDMVRTAKDNAAKVKAGLDKSIEGDKTKIQNAEARLQKEKEEIDTIAKEIKDAKADLDKLKGAPADDPRVQALTTKLKGLEDQLTEKTKSVEGIKAEIDGCHNSIKQAEAEKVKADESVAVEEAKYEKAVTELRGAADRLLKDSHAWSAFSQAVSQMLGAGMGGVAHAAGTYKQDLLTAEKNLEQALSDFETKAGDTFMNSANSASEMLRQALDYLSKVAESENSTLTGIARA